MLSGIFCPGIAALTLWFGANHFATKLFEGDAEVPSTDDRKIVSAGVFLLGLWPIFSGFPFILSSLWNIHSNQFPGFEGMHTRNATIGIVQAVSGLLFVIYSGAFANFYGKRNG